MIMDTIEQERLIAHEAEAHECKTLSGWVCVCIGIMLPVTVGLLLVAVRLLGAS
jgi:hypothetical protein